MADDVKKNSTGKKVTRKKIKKSVSSARIYINCTYNNTIISIADAKGDLLAWATAGSCGFKGAKKSTPYAAQVAAEKAMERALPYGVKEADIFVKGVGVGRDQAVRGILNKASELFINSIQDITPIPHGGCRKKKVRRI